MDVGFGEALLFSGALLAAAALSGLKRKADPGLATGSGTLP